MTFNVVALTRVYAHNLFNHLQGSIGELRFFIGINTYQVLFLKSLVGIEEKNSAPGRVRMKIISGTHETMMQEPNVQQLASDLRLRLEEAQNETGMLHDEHDERTLCST